MNLRGITLTLILLISFSYGIKLREQCRAQTESIVRIRNYYTNLCLGTQGQYVYSELCNNLKPTDPENDQVWFMLSDGKLINYQRTVKEKIDICATGEGMDRGSAVKLRICNKRWEQRQQFFPSYDDGDHTSCLFQLKYPYKERCLDIRRYRTLADSQAQVTPCEHHSSLDLETGRNRSDHYWSVEHFYSIEPKFCQDLIDRVGYIKQEGVNRCLTHAGGNARLQTCIKRRSDDRRNNQIWKLTWEGKLKALTTNKCLITKTRGKATYLWLENCRNDAPGKFNKLFKHHKCSFKLESSFKKNLCVAHKHGRSLNNVVLSDCGRSGIYMDLRLPF